MKMPQTAQEIRELKNCSFASYTNVEEAEAYKLLQELKERRDNFYSEAMQATGLTRSETMEQLRSVDEYNELCLQVDEIEQGIRERYRNSFTDDPERIVFVIMSCVSSITQREFIGVLSSRKSLYEQLVKEYEGTEQPNFVAHLKKTAEANFDNFYSLLTNHFSVELEVADYYGFKHDAEQAIEAYVSKYYKKEIPAYETVLNAPTTNALGLLPSSEMDKDPFTGELHTIVHYGKHAITFSIDADGSSLAPAQAEKVFDAFIRKLSGAVDYRATPEEILRAREQTLSVREYMDLCDLSDPKSAKEQLTKSVQWIYSTSAEWEEEIYFDVKTGKKLKTPEVVRWQARFFDSIGENKSKPIKKGEIHVKINPDIVTYLSYSYVMKRPTALFRINHKRNPNSYRLGKKLSEHKNMNLNKPNGNRIAVKTLLEAAPGIPKYEDVMQDSRHITRKIIEPFERDLFALIDEGVCEDIHYCNSKGVPLTDRQLKDYSYNEWIEWLVEFTLKDYPEQSEK